MPMTLERTTEITNELSHGCIDGVCPIPCPYKSSADGILMPEMIHVEG